MSQKNNLKDKLNDCNNAINNYKEGIKLASDSYNFCMNIFTECVDLYKQEVYNTGKVSNETSNIFNILLENKKVLDEFSVKDTKKDFNLAYFKHELDVIKNKHKDLVRLKEQKKQIKKATLFFNNNLFICTNNKLLFTFTVKEQFVYLLLSNRDGIIMVDDYRAVDKEKMYLGYVDSIKNRCKIFKNVKMSKQLKHFFDKGNFLIKISSEWLEITKLYNISMPQHFIVVIAKTIIDKNIIKYLKPYFVNRKILNI